MFRRDGANGGAGMPSFRQIRKELTKLKEADARTDSRIQRRRKLIRKLDLEVRKKRLVDSLKRTGHELRHPVKAEIERQLQRLKKDAERFGAPWQAVKKVCLLKPGQLKGIRKEASFEIKLIDCDKHNKRGRHVIGELHPVKNKPDRRVDAPLEGFPKAKRVISYPPTPNTVKIVYHFCGTKGKEYQQDLGFELTVIIDGKGFYQLNTRYGQFSGTSESGIKFKEKHPLKSQRERAEQLVAAFRKMASI